MCFILSAIAAVTKNTLSSAPSIKRGGERHIRVCMRGGPAVARLGPLLFVPGWSGGLLRRRIQGDLGPGSLALREGGASCRAWVPSIWPTLRRSGLRGGWRWFCCLLSRCRPGATGSSRRAGALREEVSHCLRQLLSLCEAFSKALQTGCLTKPERRGRELCPPLSSLSSWARGGALILPWWWLWWRVEPGLSCSSDPWVKLHSDRLPY